MVGHKIRDKARKEDSAFILNGRATVQGEGHKNYHTEWGLSPAIELPALQSIIAWSTIFDSILKLLSRDLPDITCKLPINFVKYIDLVIGVAHMNNSSRL